MDTMNKTPRKLIREAPGLVPDVLAKPSAIGGSSKDLFKGFIQRAETLSAEHKKLLSNPAFSGCSPQIVDGVLFLEIYPCEIYYNTRAGLSNSGDVNRNDSNDPSNAKFFKLGLNGTVTPQIKSANPFSRVRNDSAFSASPDGSRPNSRANSPSTQYNGHIPKRIPSETHEYNIHTHGHMERTPGQMQQEQRKAGSSSTSPPIRTITPSTRPQHSNLRRASTRSAETDNFENAVLILNVFLFFGVVFSFLILLFVIACDIDQRFVAGSHRTAVLFANYK